MNILQWKMLAGKSILFLLLVLAVGFYCYRYHPPTARTASVFDKGNALPPSGSAASVSEAAAGAVNADVLYEEKTDTLDPSVLTEITLGSNGNYQKKPSHVVVIDAGHGGYDEGAYSYNQLYHEKDYTLKVVYYLKQLLENSDIQAYYTRLEDTDVSKPSRVKLANSQHADAFVSIHCNASDPGDTTANGMEALYASHKKAASDTLTSKELAKNILDELCDYTGRRRRKVIKRDSLYLMRHSTVPVTIIETGYMSNKSDMNYLLDDTNQRAIAQGIYMGIVKSLKEKQNAK